MADQNPRVLAQRTNRMTRISEMFRRLKERNERALIPYLTAGDPAPARTVELMLALEKGGANLIELGVPFSDPIADGPVIQKASDRALKAGTTFAGVLDILREFRKRSELPVIIFSYLNPILRYGFERFAAAAADAGADGALLTDLNVEEAAPYRAGMQRHNLDTVFLATQTTPGERLRAICGHSSGFVYLVSRAGVTGESSSLSTNVLPLIERARAATPLPLAVGFGLSRPEHLAAIAPHAEAAIVGSAFMRLIEQQQHATDLADQLCSFAAHLKSGFAAAAADSPE